MGENLNSNNKLDSWPKITLLGDSITRYSTDPENGCWASYLSHEVANYFQVDVRGFSGYTTELILKYLPQLFTKEYLKDVSLFVIFFGHNDSWQSEFFPSVKIEDYELNLKNIIEQLVQGGLSREQIILISPAWYCPQDFEEWLRKKNHPDISKNKEHSEKYAQVVVKVAQEEGVSVLDWWTISLKHEPFPELFCDGLHLSRCGAKLLFDSIWEPLLKPKLESLYKVKSLDELSMLPTIENITVELLKNTVQK